MNEDMDMLDHLVLEGRATKGEGCLLDVLEELGSPVSSSSSVRPSEALAELRAEER